MDDLAEIDDHLVACNIISHFFSNKPQMHQNGKMVVMCFIESSIPLPLSNCDGKIYGLVDSKHKIIAILLGSMFQKKISSMDIKNGVLSRVKAI